MSNKNSAECDTKSECDCDFYSKYLEEIATHINKDLLESGGESDLYVPLHHNSPSSSFENKKEKSNLSEIVLFPQNNQTNFKNCYIDHPLLKSQTVENTGQFQAELSPELSDCPSKDFPYVCDGSCNENLCLNSKIPHLIITEKLDEEPCVYTIKESYATDKVHQKQPLADYPPTSIQEKPSQISFLCRKEETGANIYCECFEQSPISEGNKSLDRKSTISYSSECTCHEKPTSSQLVKEHLECSSVSSSKTGSPQVAEQTYAHASSEGLTISLALEAGTINTTGSLAVDISPSKTREHKEDSQLHALAFKFTDSEHNNLFQKLSVSIIPNISYSALLDTESQEQIIPFTKQTGLPKTLDDEASQPVTTHTKSPESSSPKILTDQVPSTLKQWSAKQLLLPCKAKPIHEAQSSYCSIKSVPYHKVAPKAEVQKHSLKAYRPVNSVVFTKNKGQKDKIFRSRPYIVSEPNWPNTGAVYLFPNQSVKESVINELDYSPLTWPTCHCSPLLDLTINLSERKYSSTETFLKVHRKPQKQVGGGKVIPRFSPQYLVNQSSFEKLQCFFPIRKKNSQKMHSILTSCLGQVKGCNKYENDKGEVCFTLDNSNAVGNGLFVPCAPADGRCSVTSPLLRAVNSCIHHSAALPPPSERRHSPTPSVQTERESLKLAGLCPDCKCKIISNSPHSGYIVNVIQSPKERNIVNSLCMEEPNLGTTQVACEDLVLKKFSVCPCGNVPQHGLFPCADNSWSEKKKTKASPKINKRASILESNEVNCPKGTFDTVGVCCTNCHHCYPTCFCSQSMNIQDASRNQFTKIQFPFENGFSNKKLKDFEEKSNAVKSNARKNCRIHIGPDTLQEFSPSDTHAVPPSKDGDSTPKYVMYCPKCCSGCQTAVQHRGTSKDAFNSLSSKQTMLNNCLNRKSVFLMDPGQRTRNQCKCSQEISIFHLDQADLYKIHKAMLSKREESNVIQDSSG